MKRFRHCLQHHPFYGCYWVSTVFSDMVLNIALMNVIFGVIKGNLAKWWYGVTAAVTFFAMISFQLYNQESIASIAVSFAVKLVIFAVTIYYTFRVAGKEIEYSDD